MKATRCLPIVLAHLAVMVTGTWADLGRKPLFQPALSPVKTRLANLGSSTVSIVLYAESWTQSNTPMQISCQFDYTSLIIRGELCRWDPPMNSTESCVVLSALSFREMKQGKNSTTPYTLSSADRHATYCCKDFSFSSEGINATLIGCGTVDDHVQSPSTPNTPDTSVPTVATSGRSPPTEDPQAPTLRDTTTHTTQTEHMPSRAPPPTVHRDTTLNNIVAIICALLFAGGIVLAVNLICKCKNRGIYSSRFKLLRCTVKSTSQLRDGTSLAQKRIVDLPSLRDSYSMTAKTQHCSCPMLKAVSLDVESQLPVGDPGAARNPVRNAYSMNDVAAAEGPATLAVEHATGAISINQLQDEVRSAEEKVADLSLLHDPMAGKKRCSSWPVLDTVSLGAGHQLPAGVRRASRTSVRPAYSTNGVTAEEGPASFEDATGVPVTNKDSSQTVGIGGSLYATLASSAPMNQDVLAMLRTCTNILQHTGENGEESDLVLSSSSGEVTTYHFGAKQGIEKSSPNRQSAVMSHSPTEITPQSSSRGAPDTQQWPPQAPTVPRGKTMPSTDTTHGTVVDVPLGLPTVPGRLHHCSASASDIGEKVVELSILSATPTTTSNTHPANSPVSTAFKQQAAACNSSQTDTMSQTEDRASPETFDPLTHSCSQQSSTPLPGPTSLEESKSAFTSLTCLPSEEDSDGRDFTISGLYAAAEKNGPSSVATIYHQERPTNSSPLSPIRLIASPKTGDPIPKSFVSQSTTPLPDTSESQVASSNSQPFMADSDTRDFTISGWFATADINHQVASIQSSQALPLSQTVSTAPLEANFPLRNNFFNESNTHFLIPRFI